MQLLLLLLLLLWQRATLLPPTPRCCLQRTHTTDHSQVVQSKSSMDDSWKSSIDDS